MRIFFLSSEEEGKVNITFRQRFLGRMRYTCNSSWEVKRKGRRIQEEGIETCFVRRGKDSLFNKSQFQALTQQQLQDKHHSLDDEE